MRYTEAIEEIIKNRNKTFVAYSKFDNKMYRIEASRLFVNLMDVAIDYEAGYLSFEMLELDWEEETKE